MRARLLRDEISQRELAARVARSLGRASAAGALQKALSRVELAPEPATLAADVVDALERELELVRGDLSWPYRWAYRLTCRSFAPDSLAWLGGRVPIFSSAALAYEARGWVTFGAGYVIPELEFAHPYEAFHAELEREVGGDWARAVLDPCFTDFRALAGRPVVSETSRRFLSRPVENWATSAG